MNRRRYRRGRSSLSSIVDDSAQIASRLGPGGAMVTGALGFMILYAVLPITILNWMAARNARVSGATSIELSNLAELIVWHRMIEPMQWAGIAIFIVCTVIAIWKLVTGHDMTSDVRSNTSALARLIARMFQ